VFGGGATARSQMLSNGLRSLLQEMLTSCSRDPTPFPQDQVEMNFNFPLATVGCAVWRGLRAAPVIITLISMSPSGHGHSLFQRFWLGLWQVGRRLPNLVFGES
jgi:hypothetical protein